jgi:hypothetical protein
MGGNSGRRDGDEVTHGRDETVKKVGREMEKLVGPSRGLSRGSS